MVEYIIMHSKQLRGFENLQFQIDLKKITKTTKNKSFPNLSDCCSVPIKIKKFCGNCSKEITDIKALKNKLFKLGKESHPIPVAHLEQIRKQLDDNKIVITEYRDVGEIDPLFYTELVFSSQQHQKSKKEYNEFKELLKMSNKVGIGTMILNHRPYVCMVYHYKNHICFRMLHFEDEIEPQPAIDDTIQGNQQKIELMNKMLILNTAKCDFDIAKFKNTRQQAEEELIELVIDGKELPKIDQIVEVQTAQDTDEIARLQALLEDGDADSKITA